MKWPNKFCHIRHWPSICYNQYVWKNTNWPLFREKCYRMKLSALSLQKKSVSNVPSHVQCLDREKNKYFQVFLTTTCIYNLSQHCLSPHCVACYFYSSRSFSNVPFTGKDVNEGNIVYLDFRTSQSLCFEATINFL